MRQTLLASLAALALAPPTQALEVTDKATLAWEAAAGPVVGYYVIVARNGAAPALESVTDKTTSDVHGEPGDSAVVQVAAFGADGAAGPLSEPSEQIDFVAAPSDPGSGGGSDPGSGSGDETGPGSGSEPGDGSGSGGGTGMHTHHDFDCDGRSDLIVRGADGHYAIWALAGGTLTGKIDLPTASALDALVGAGDYDGNGCADLLWQDLETGQLSVWTLDAGRFASRQVLEALALPAAEDWRVGGSGDFDGDGTDDLLLYSLVVGEVEVWRMRDGDAIDALRLGGRTGDWAVPALIDGDGDGDAEVLWYEADSRHLEHLDPATGVETRLWKMVKHWAPVTSADFDGDGVGDVLVRNTRRGITAVLGVLDGELDDVIYLPDSSGMDHPAGFGDYDGDGMADIAWVDTRRGVVTLWLEAGLRQVELAELLEPGASVQEARGTVD